MTDLHDICITRTVRYTSVLYLTGNHFHPAYMTLSINSSSIFIVSDFIRHLILLRPVMQTPPTMWWWKVLVLVVAAIGTVHAASRDQWLGRSVYQVVTDRFARADNSTTASCDAGLGEYWGGVYRASSISWIIFRNSGSMQFGSLQCKARSQLARRISQV